MPLLPSRTLILFIASLALSGMLVWVLGLKGEVAQLRLELAQRETADRATLARAWAGQAQALDRAIAAERRRGVQETARNRALIHKVEGIHGYQAPLDESLRVLLNGLSGDDGEVGGQGLVPTGAGVVVGTKTDAR